MENNERDFSYIDTAASSASKVNKNILHYAVKRYTSVAVRIRL
jgi:hypothetical protein